LENFKKEKDEKMKCVECGKVALSVCNDKKARCKKCMDIWLKNKLISQGLFKGGD
jgi:hypothetical protein